MIVNQAIKPHRFFSQAQAITRSHLDSIFEYWCRSERATLSPDTLPDANDAQS